LRKKEKKMGRACGTYGGVEIYTVLMVGKSEENGPPGRPKIRWVYSVRMSSKSGMEAWNGFIWL